MNYLVYTASEVQEQGVNNKLEKNYVDLNVLNSFTIARIYNLLADHDT